MTNFCRGWTPNYAEQTSLLQKRIYDHPMAAQDKYAAMFWLQAVVLASLALQSSASNVARLPPDTCRAWQCYYRRQISLSHDVWLWILQLSHQLQKTESHMIAWQKEISYSQASLIRRTQLEKNDLSDCDCLSMVPQEWTQMEHAVLAMLLRPWLKL